MKRLSKSERFRCSLNGVSVATIEKGLVEEASLWLYLATWHICIYVWQ